MTHILSFLLLVSAYFDHDYIVGATRTCIYTSIYGSHAMTITAMSACPMVMDFEV